MRIPGPSKHSREELVNPLRQSPAGAPWPITPARLAARWLKMYLISSPTAVHRPDCRLRFGLDRRNDNSRPSIGTIYRRSDIALFLPDYWLAHRQHQMPAIIARSGRVQRFWQPRFL